MDEIEVISANLAWLATVVNSLQSTDTVSFAAVTTGTEDVEPSPATEEKTE